MSRIEVALRLCINSSTSKFFHSLSFPGSKPDCRGGRTADFCQTYIHSQCSHCPLDSDIDVLYCAPTPRQRYEGCSARTFFISRLNMCLTREDFPTPDLRTVSHFKKRRSRKVLTLPTTRIRNLLMIEKDRKSFKASVHTWDTLQVFLQPSMANRSGSEPWRRMRRKVQCRTPGRDPSRIRIPISAGSRRFPTRGCDLF